MHRADFEAVFDICLVVIALIQPGKINLLGAFDAIEEFGGLKKYPGFLEGEQMFVKSLDDRVRVGLSDWIDAHQLPGILIA